MKTFLVFELTCVQADAAAGKLGRAAESFATEGAPHLAVGAGGSRARFAGRRRTEHQEQEQQT